MKEIMEQLKTENRALLSKENRTQQNQQPQPLQNLTNFQGYYPPQPPPFQQYKPFCNNNNWRHGGYNNNNNRGWNQNNKNNSKWNNNNNNRNWNRGNFSNNQGPCNDSRVPTAGHMDFAGITVRTVSRPCRATAKKQHWKT